MRFSFLKTKHRVGLWSTFGLCLKCYQDEWKVIRNNRQQLGQSVIYLYQFPFCFYNNWLWIRDVYNQDIIKLDYRHSSGFEKIE